MSVFQLISTEIFLFLHGNKCCGYSLEVPHWGTSNEYPQYMFPWRNKKTISYVKSYWKDVDVIMKGSGVMEQSHQLNSL